MRNLLLFLALIAGGGFYVHEEQPALWNKWVQQGTAQLASVPQLQAWVHKLLPMAGRPDGSPGAPGEYVDPSTTTLADSSHVRDVSPSDLPGGSSQRVFTPPATLPAQPNWTWTTTDGQHVYKNVVVCKVEADCVTILDDDGGARVDIATLPLEIQKQLNYDPDLAANASAERQQQERASQSALLLEKQQSAEMAKANSVSAETNDATILDAAAQQRASADAVARIQQAQSELANWEDDLRITKGHLGMGIGGIMTGDPYWLSKYDEDTHNIDELNEIIRSGGKK